jgi:hypothetical protein
VRAPTRRAGGRRETARLHTLRVIDFSLAPMNEGASRQAPAIGGSSVRRVRFTAVTGRDGSWHEDRGVVEPQPQPQDQEPQLNHKPISLLRLGVLHPVSEPHDLRERRSRTNRRGISFWSPKLPKRGYP